MLNFLKYLFYKELEVRDKKRYNQILKMELPDELWLTKWLLTLFCGYTTKVYKTRIWDFLMVEDFMGPVYVALVIILQTKKSLFRDMGETIIRIQKAETLCGLLDFTKFVKQLQVIKTDIRRKKILLESYNAGLKGEEKKDFKEFYERLSIYLNREFLENKTCKSLLKIFFKSFVIL